MSSSNRDTEMNAQTDKNATGKKTSSEKFKDSYNLSLKAYDELFSTEETFCDQMKILELAVRDVLASDKITSKKDKKFLKKFADDAKFLAKSPLLSAKFNKDISSKEEFDSALNSLNTRYTSDEFKLYMNNMGDYVRNYVKFLDRFSKLQEKYKNFNELIQNGLDKNKKSGLALKDYIILPIQRAPRYQITTQAIADKYVDSTTNKTAQNISEMAKKNAGLINNKINYVSESVKHLKLLYSLDKLTKDTKKQFKNVNVLDMPPLKENFENIITNNKDGVLKKIREIKPNTPEYNKLNDNEKILHGALAKKSKFQKDSNKEKVAKYDALINKLSNLILLEEKKANVEKMKEILSQTKDYVDMQVKEKNFLESELTKMDCRKQINKIEKGYEKELKAIDKEVNHLETKLKKSSFVRHSLKTFKLLEKNASEPLPAYTSKPLTLPPEELLPSIPKDEPIPPPPTVAPPSLPDGVIRQQPKQEISTPETTKVDTAKKPISPPSMTTAHVFDVIHHHPVQAAKHQKQENKETQSKEMNQPDATPRRKSSAFNSVQISNQGTPSNKKKQNQSESEHKKFKL